MDLSIILIAGGAICLIMLVIGIVFTVSTEKSMVEERLGRYITPEKIVAEERRKGPRSTPLTDWINSRVQRSSFGETIAKELARADLKFRPGEYIAIMGISSVLLGFVLWFLMGGPLFGLIGLAAGPLIPRGYVKSQQAKRLVKFNEQLPDMLNLMVNGLRAGYATMQAMEAVGKELPPPISDEFRRVVQEMQLGVAMEKALDNLLRRIPSDDLDLVITAINVQREVGGNLAEILDTISYTIRERVRIKGEIRVLTTQVMYSGKFLAMLPLIVVGILFLLNKQYIMVYFDPKTNSPIPCGFIALGLAAFLIVMGYISMTKLGEIEI